MMLLIIHQVRVERDISEVFELALEYYSEKRYQLVESTEPTMTVFHRGNNRTTTGSWGTKDITVNMRFEESGGRTVVQIEHEIGFWGRTVHDKTDCRRETDGFSDFIRAHPSSMADESDSESIKRAGNILRDVAVPQQTSYEIAGSDHLRQPSRAKVGYLVGGGLTAAIFFGLFYWAVNYTYTERVWHEMFLGYGYWEEITHTLDPAIQASFLVVAIVGLIAMIYGAVSRKQE